MTIQREALAPDNGSIHGPMQPIISNSLKYLSDAINFVFVRRFVSATLKEGTKQKNNLKKRLSSKRRVHEYKMIEVERKELECEAVSQY